MEGGLKQPILALSESCKILETQTFFPILPPQAVSEQNFTAEALGLQDRTDLAPPAPAHFLGPPHPNVPTPTNVPLHRPPSRVGSSL